MDQKNLAIVLSSILIIALAGAFLMLNRDPLSISDIFENENDSFFTQEPSSAVSSDVPASAIAGWKTYQNTEFNFSVSIPQNMNVLSEDSMGDLGCQVYFGKQTERKEGHDGEWAILVYNKSKHATEELISQAGSQFGADKKEERENITINGLPAVKAIITTSTQPDWRFEGVFLEEGEYIYEFSNGAVKDDDYGKFYNSFKLAK